MNMKLSLYVAVVLTLLMGCSGASAQTAAEPKFFPPEKVKTVQYENVFLELVPPSGKWFHNNPDLVGIVTLGAPNAPMLGVAVNPADIAEALAGNTKDYSFAVISTPRSFKGVKVSADVFLEYKKVMKEQWSSVIKQVTPQVKADIDKVNPGLKRRYNLTLNENPSERPQFVTLGPVAEGDAFITVGLLSKNGVVRFNGKKKLSSWVHLFTTVLVKDKMIDLKLAEPYVSQASVLRAKTMMSQWVQDFLAKNDVSSGNVNSSTGAEVTKNPDLGLPQLPSHASPRAPQPRLAQDATLRLADSGPEPARGDGSSDGPGSRGTGGGIKRLDTDVAEASRNNRNARAAFKARVEFPDRVKTQSFKDVIRIRVTIEADGTHSSQLLDASGSADVDSALLRALSRWRWEPAMENGKPVRSTERFSFEINIK